MSLALFILSITCFIASLFLNVKETKKSWNKLYSTFETSLKIPWDSTSRGVVAIDKKRYKNVVILVEREGILMAPYGIIPRFFASGQILIPWEVCTDVHKMTHKVLGMTVQEVYIKVKAEFGEIELELPEVYLEKILENDFLKIN